MTRLSAHKVWLLAAVRDGLIGQYGDGHSYHHQTGWRCTAAVKALAGWVTLGTPEPARTPWVLTAAGNAALAAAQRAVMS